MRTIGFLIFFITASVSTFCQKTGAYNSKDEAALKQLPVRWQWYWNSHNMDSMGTMFCEDIDFVNVAGVWLKGKAATVLDHRQKHQGLVFENSTWATDSVTIKYVKPDLAIVHIGWGLKDDNDPDGTPRKPRHGIFTWVVIKEKARWLILAGHNVNIREPVAPAN